MICLIITTFRSKLQLRREQAMELILTAVLAFKNKKKMFLSLGHPSIFLKVFCLQLTDVRGFQMVNRMLPGTKFGANFTQLQYTKTFQGYFLAA